ncbi:hypothetical protein [Deinococcus apachensis]|uniref:hypothetical protein n=1 Tax=Deinococcus apachensis TaxID=309886 RepID=UPI000381BFBF|nr:hypothetical protein [Deinococcus apachensis]
MNRSRKNAPLIALAAALPLTAGLVLAQQSTAPQRVQPAQPGQTIPGTRNQSGQTTPTRPQTSDMNYADVFLQKLAAQLGITVERLKAAAVAAGSATIDQGVQAGDIPQDRAADLKARLQDAPLNFGFGGRGGHGGRLGFDGPNGQVGGRGAFGQAVTAAVARTLGLTEQALAQQLQSGQTVAQIAQAKGVSTAAVRNAALAALKTSLTAGVQAGQLTQAQADALLARAQADQNFGLTFGRGGRGGFGRDGQDGPRGFGQPGNQTSPTTGGANT